MLDVTIKTCKNGSVQIDFLKFVNIIQQEKNNILTLLKNKLLWKHCLKVFVPSWQENSVGDFI
jgi:hypothetical protein